MKKTLFTLSAIALVCAGQAQAYTLFDSEETGTKLDLTGSLRLQWRSTSEKDTDYQSNSVTKEHINHAISNNGSRFGFRLTQMVSDDIYLLGRVEWRFRGTSSSQHDFDDIYTRQLYAGVGHKKYGELTYGNQTLITDEVKQTDLPNTLSLSDGLLDSAARRSVQYVYKGIEGLKVGAYYGSDSPRNNRGVELTNKRKDTWGAGAIYKYTIDDEQSVKIGTGFSKQRWNVRNADRVSDATAYSLGTAYTYKQTTLGLDLERKVTKNDAALGDKETQKEVRTVVFHRIIPAKLNAYAMYAYKTDKLNSILNSNTEDKTHQFMFGAEYYIVPNYVKTFVEWQTSRTKTYTNGLKTQKTRDNITVIGLRVYW